MMIIIIIWNIHLNPIANVRMLSCDAILQGRHIMGRPLLGTKLINMYAEDRNYYHSYLVSQRMDEQTLSCDAMMLG